MAPLNLWLNQEFKTDLNHDVDMIDVLTHNRDAWNAESHQSESPWCRPVDEQIIANARIGNWEVVLTPSLSVPKNWFGNVNDKNILCLASGGGQQAPILAAAGANVTSFDRSEAQLAKDELVAIREGLDIELVCGDMADLACFDAEQFELIFHPVSNLFASNIRPVWQECSRVLAASGRLLSGFMNPDFFLFDLDAVDAGEPLLVSNQLPYSDIEDLPKAALQARIDRGEALEFSHSLNDQIGGQLEAGFVIAGFYEDRW
ncbi:MAG: class I SAM-dependent methyltransferase, partial [Gammaproteobacteria bacterium]|nr:class I SAM-dependent methyltransferase [Gammaproteobacteria bacterium]